MVVAHGIPVKAGTVDVSVILRVIDSTDGTPEPGVDHATSGLDLKYWREGATPVDFTEAAIATLDAAHVDYGVEQIGTGYIRVDLPDAAVASGVEAVHVFGTATGMVVIGATIPIVAYDPHDTVRLGLTALPNAAADAAGGLPISDAGGLDLDAKVGALTYGTANRVNAQVYGMEANTLTATAINADAITDAKVAADVTIASVTGAVGSVTGAVGSVAAGGIAATSFAAGAIDAAAIAADAITDAKVAADVTIASVTGAVGSVTGNVGGNVVGSVGSVVGHTPQTGDSFARLGAPIGASLSADLQVIDTNVDDIETLLGLTDADVASILALLDDPRGEPAQGAPAVNPDMATKVDWLYKFLRNKITQTATTMSVYADDGTTVDHKSTVSDDGTTFTRGEIVSGP